ncbi:hypothetical protein B0H12DRAFT_202723 [Mycena haematopus]|nr:hypothetical protein B0H12DRAFT_202723 [Mycena haematopus]
MIIRSSLLAICVLSWHVQTCISTVSNRTIDDFYGDPVTGAVPSYEPSGVWNAVVNSNCTICFVRPDATQAFDNTWHDATLHDESDPPSVTLQFTGTAIYLFGIVPNTVPSASTIVDLTFFLDGASAGSYTHTPDTSTTILYSVPLLSLSGLSNKTHTLLAQTTDFFIFDYAIYTFDDGVSESSSAGITSSSTTSSASASSNSNQTVTKGAKSHFPVAAVVESICGVAGAALLVFALLWCRRRRKNQSVPPSPVNLELLVPMAEDSTQSWTPYPYSTTETLPETREVSPPPAPPSLVDTSLPPYTPAPHQKNPSSPVRYVANNSYP